MASVAEEFYQQNHGSTEPESGSEREEFFRYGGSECSDESSETVEESVRQEMENLEITFRGLGLKYRMIDRIGEGTFSTVYKAEDLHYDYYQNDWDSEKGVRWRRKSRSESPTSRQSSRKPHYVAIKKIYVTSSPGRIQNELELLNDLKGCKSVCPLITAFRHYDQVVAVLPYFSHHDFRIFYRQMNAEDIRMYFRSLFEALAAVHRHGIIHRDIKPTNFLYDAKRGRGVLVDFGLAEVLTNGDPVMVTTNSRQRQETDYAHCLCQEEPETRRYRIEASKDVRQATQLGHPKNDNRPSRRANRAGTRGFRAPEVLFKCTAQTTKIDMWSAGVILLTILCQRFPFFNSADDVEAIIEIASLFGQRRLRQCALLHGTIFECTVPTVGEKGHTLEHLVQWSISKVRPEEEDVLQPELKKIIKFMGRLLELDPKKRLSARSALTTEFLSGQTSETEEEEVDLVGGLPEAQL